MKERVQKLMAQANLGSRRAAEELIRQQRVRINGVVAKLGDQADPAADIIEVDGERLRFDTQKHYFAINKPLYVLSTNLAHRNDERQTIREFIPYEGHLFTIGRLDAESDGLIVLTNDGEMANKLAHPRFEHTKTYKVVVYGSPTQETLDRWEKGVFLEDGLTAPCSIRVQQREPGVTVLKIVMIEGKKRQIRRVASLLEHPVKRLTRTHIGKLELGTLRHGEWYELKPEDIELMQTPGSDLGYIRRLRRDQREVKRRDYLRQQQGQQAESRREASPYRSTERDGERGERRSSLSRISRPSEGRFEGDSGEERTPRNRIARDPRDSGGERDKNRVGKSRSENRKSERESARSGGRSSGRKFDRDRDEARTQARNDTGTRRPRQFQSDAAPSENAERPERGERSRDEVRRDQFKPRSRSDSRPASRPPNRRPSGDRPDRTESADHADRTESRSDDRPGNRPGTRSGSRPAGGKRPGAGTPRSSGTGSGGRSKPARPAGRSGGKPTGGKPSGGSRPTRSGNRKSGGGGGRKRNDDE
jgi:pseudouridine synthase